jgi:hypothetical protein
MRARRSTTTKLRPGSRRLWCRISAARFTSGSLLLAVERWYARWVAAGCTVEASDIADGRDFLRTPAIFNCDAIVTNPPYSRARGFIEHAIEVMQPSMGKVAMLLRTDYDHAKGRQHLFGECPMFAKKLVLTRRIVWFDGPKAAPSFNHAWYIWDWKHVGPPVLAYC